MKKVLVVLFALTIVGCSTLRSITGDVADRVAVAIDQYCAETDQIARNELRSAINSRTAGHTVVVTCVEVQ